MAGVCAGGREEKRCGGEGVEKKRGEREEPEEKQWNKEEAGVERQQTGAS